MSVRGLVLAVVASLGGLACWLGFAVGPAFGAIGHNYETQIAGVGPSEPFGSPWGLAFDSSGSLFVADPGSATVDVFDHSNALVTQAGKGFLSGGYARGVAVSQSSGDIYVGDSNKSEVFVMKPNGSGGYEGLSAWKGNSSAAGSFGGNCCYVYTAVDNSTSPSDPRAGDVYVLTTQQVVDVFKPKPAGSEEALEGELVGELSTAGGFSFGESDGLAVDAATGNVYVADPGNKIVRVFSDQGSEEPLLALSGAETPQGASFTPIAVAIDDVNEVVYVVDGSAKAVDEFSKAGTYMGQTTATPGGELSEPRGVAVQEHAGATQGDVYVSDSGAKVVDVFGGPGVVLAGVKTEPASNVRKNTVTLNGTVNPDEVPITACTFEYRSSEEASFTHTEACATSPGSGNAPVAVSAEVSGLTSGMTYYYRLAATNANGTNRRGEESFTTLLAVDGVSTGPAEEVTATGAKLTGSLSPDGTDAHYYFEYGTTAGYGSTSPASPGVDAGTGGAGCVPPGGGTCKQVAAESALGALQPETTYHYRIVATNEFGTGYGQDETLTTRSAVDGVSTGPAKEVTATHAKLTGSLSPDGTDAHYYFEYGTTTGYGSTSPSPPGADAGTGGAGCVPPGGSSCTPASAETLLGTLEPGTTYHYRLVAVNSLGTTYGHDETLTTAGAKLDGESVRDVTDSSATLGASIDPNGYPTSYYFQYGTDTGYGVEVPAAPGVALGSVQGAVEVSQHIQGLIASTVYHYRAVLVVELSPGVLETFDGPDHAFTTQTVGSLVQLPDGRAWEMVTPAEKYGSGVFALGWEQGDDIQASVEGGAITYGATAPFAVNPAGSRSPEVTQVYSARSAPGSWRTADITTAHTEGGSQVALGHSAEYKLFSSDLSAGLVEPNGHTPLPPLPPGSEKTIYLRLADGEYRALVTSANVPAGTRFGGDGEGAGAVWFVGATPDLSHVVLGSHAKLTSTPVEEGGAYLYEWAGGQLQLASILPDEQPAQAELGEANTVVRHAISSDGSRIVFEVRSSSGGHYYLRDMSSKKTVQVDAAQGAPVNEPESRYKTANSEDSRVFFTSPQKLTADSTASYLKEDLYQFEITSAGGEPPAGKLVDLSVDGNVGEGADVRGVIGASEDGTQVYFVANGVLGDGAEHGAKPGSCEGLSQQTLGVQCNLYTERYDAAAKAWSAPAFIAALSGDDAHSWWRSPNLTYMTSRVSPDGRYLAFMSDRSLTGYENRDANSGAPDEEVYLYDASTGRLVCASCNPTGARPVGSTGSHGSERPLWDYAQNWVGQWVAGDIPGWTTKDLNGAVYQSRYLSDGGRLFFNSSDALVPADVNGKEDVYEYEPAGMGSCQGSGHGASASDVFDAGAGGCVALISAGSSSEESTFMDASEGGGDVFFITGSRLASQDLDTSFDVYDAHVCTAVSPCAPPVALVLPPCTTGDACKAAPAPQPAIFGAPSSETFSGAGNVVPSTSGAGTATPRSATQRQKLARALKACAKKPRKRRAACKRRARGRYGARKSRVGKSLSARTRRVGA